MDDGADERRYLRDGYRVLSLNWRGDCREIDLGEERDGVMALCEVKPHSSGVCGSPAEAIAARRRAAECLGALLECALEVRFDAVSALSGRAERLEDTSEGKPLPIAGVVAHPSNHGASAGADRGPRSG